MRKNIKISATIAAVGIFSAASIYQIHSHKKYSLQNAMNFYGFRKPEQKEALNNLLNLSGVSPLNKPYSISNIFKSNQNQLAEDILNLVKITQQRFTIRAGTQERWETQSQEWMLKNNDEILANLNTLGFINEISPKIKNPDAVCILGATRKRMSARIAYAEELMSRQMKTGHMILLVGERYVTANVDATESELSSIAAKFNISDWKKLTETHLARELYSVSSLSKNSIPVSVIDTPRGDLPRPTTQTTIMSLIQWLNDHPSIKNIVFISNQPNAHYQKAVIDAVLHENNVKIDFEVIGPTAGREYEVKSILEGLGSYIWAATPAVLSSLNLEITDNEIKNEFIKLYSGNPLVFQALPENLKEMSRESISHRKAG